MSTSDKTAPASLLVGLASLYYARESVLEARRRAHAVEDVGLAAAQSARRPEKAKLLDALDAVVPRELPF